MKPMEAYAVLLRIHTELTHMRQALYPKGKCFSQEELAAIQTGLHQSEGGDFAIKAQPATKTCDDAIRRATQESEEILEGLLLFTSEPLQEEERQSGAVWSGTILYPPGYAAFNPDREDNERQDDREHNHELGNGCE